MKEKAYRNETISLRETDPETELDTGEKKANKDRKGNK